MSRRTNDSSTPGSVPDGPTRPRVPGWANLALTITLSMVAPLVVFNVAKGQGASDVSAYLLASAPPLLEAVLVAVLRRTLDTFAVVMVSLNVLSAAVAVVGDTGPTFLLLKDSAITAAFGLLCLVTLLPVVPRPLMFYFAQRFAGRGTPEGEARFGKLWQYPSFRGLMRLITGLWGAGYVLEALVKVVVAETTSFQAAYNLNQVLPILVAGTLAAVTIVLARRGKRAGERRQAAAAEGEPHSV
ncbi:VC0807 family protein [Agilicoccus flavus]|uniref:VC0807 family protein n=1 Tax=Agilicoccus flavus TaxID=2775968 RepID=UPI001CF69361|nr:VC0807 family protein [Agilicoccus flavus]